MTEPSRADYRFFHHLRVRWAEVDMQKIVFNAHYLMYLDTAVADYWRALALPYEAAMQQLDGDVYVKKASLEYHASARYDDRLDIGLKCERIGNSSFSFRGGIFRDDELLISADLLYVFANPVTQKSRPVPPPLRALFASYEQGAGVVTTRLGSWAELGAAIWPIRTEVLVQEQGIAAELVDDGADPSALHLLLCNQLGMPVATGRLQQLDGGVSRLARIAVSRVLRGSGLGRLVLDTLVQAAAQRGDRSVVLQARHSAQGFYARAGFTAQGEPYAVAGSGHIDMARSLG